MEEIIKNLTVLHIANDYTGSTVYKNLYKALDAQYVSQIIYTAVRNPSLLNRNLIEFENSSSNIIYSHILNLYTRINFKYKIRKILFDVEKKVNFVDVSILHAHTWYSDGAVAFELYKRHHIPYIVTVRNTDLNLFFKYFYHLRKYGLDILRNAKKIIFISPVYKKRLFEIRTIKSLKSVEDKSIVIPNGIDPFWISNVTTRKTILNNPQKLLFIGKFTKGKNLFRIIKALELSRKNGRNVELTIVGGDGSQQKNVLEGIENKTYIHYLGKVYNKEKLREIYGGSDVFIMPSKSETFGLVYIEALSQGIPIIYTKNEGIDGLHNEQIGEAVNAKDILDIANSIEKIIKNYSSYGFDPGAIINKHNWDIIAKDYKKTYSELL